MQLNAATLTAPTPAGTSLFSLIPTLDATPAASANSSASIAQNFSAMLTEMVGPVTSAALPQVAVTSAALPQVPFASAALPQVAVTSAALPQVAVTSAALPQVAVTSAALPQVPFASAALPQVPFASAALPQVAVTSAALPQVPFASAALPQVAVTSAALPQVAVTSAALPQVAVTSAALPQVPFASAALPQVPFASAALPRVPFASTALPQVPATSTALPRVPFASAALPQVPVTSTALPQVPGVVVPEVPPVAQVGETPQVQLGQPASTSGLQPTAANEPQKIQSMLPVDPAMPGIPAVSVPGNPQAAQNNETPQAQLPLSAVPESAGPQPTTKGPAAKPANPPVDTTLTVPVASPIEIASVLPAVTSLAETALQGTRSLLSKADEPAPTPAELAAVQQPELERAFADMTSFELNVHNETAQPAALPTLLEQQAAAANPAAQALVTTDPIANLQQQQLPPRIMPIPRVMSDAKPERGKSDSLLSSNDTTATSTPTGQATDLIRPVEQADQVLAAHYVEVPNMPHVQVVRTVAMEVGDPGSEVTIRLQARGGDVSLQLNSGNEPLRQDLESSVGSLVNSLKQAQIQVSNVDVSRKSPIDKVRRMKEAR